MDHFKFLVTNVVPLCVAHPRAMKDRTVMLSVTRNADRTIGEAVHRRNVPIRESGSLRMLKSLARSVGELFRGASPIRSAMSGTFAVVRALMNGTARILKVAVLSRISLGSANMATWKSLLGKNTQWLTPRDIARSIGLLWQSILADPYSRVRQFTIATVTGRTTALRTLNFGQGSITQASELLTYSRGLKRSSLLTNQFRNVSFSQAAA